MCSLASQTWTFAIILPLLIGHKIPVDDLHWECYLLLLQILQYSTARVSSLSSSLYLTALISQHHQIFVTCYPGVKLIPKMHYLIHFPQQICRYIMYFNYLPVKTHVTNRLGPLVTSWCMRMEAKNSYFKKAGRITNFKNIAYSVAARHQRLICGYLQSQNFFGYDELQCGPCKYYIQNIVFIHIKAGFIYKQGLKYIPGSTTE